MIRRSPYDAPPSVVEQLAARAVRTVRDALLLELTFDSETLPLLDHWLRSVPTDDEASFDRAACAAGVYFGEVVRRRLGGTWDVSEATPDEWRLELDTGVSFNPVGMAAAAITHREVEGYDDGLIAPPATMPLLKQALESMAAVTEETYYSLGGRLETLEQVHTVVLLLQREAVEKARFEG